MLLGVIYYGGGGTLHQEAHGDDALGLLVCHRVIQSALLFSPVIWGLV